MRRICPVCGTEYRHDPITAGGRRDDGVLLHLICCSWSCLVEEIADHSLVPKEVRDAGFDRRLSTVDRRRPAADRTPAERTLSFAETKNLANQVLDEAARVQLGRELTFDQRH